MLDLTNIFCLKIKFHCDKRRFDDAISTGKTILDKLGENLCFKPVTELDINKTKNLIIEKSDKISILKTMDDERLIAVAEILYRMMLSSYFSNPTLLLSITNRMIQMTFEFGISKACSLCFCVFGMHLCSRQDNLGFRFGSIALTLIEKNQAKEVIPWVLQGFYLGISPYYCSIHESTDKIYKAYKIGK